ncbi:hypothetical protein [Pseudomonas sp. FW300-N1A1]|uniref:hypothetical protein n=1 Tax=Pseudomonas sp. FW300-N1A1 TaxID=2075555 RepID=UPI0011AFAE1B|nr:hypothetical protein [Pseudomonas sp. FW300-N1A1]
MAEAFAAWATSQSLAARAQKATYKVEYVLEIRLVPDEQTLAAQVQVLPQRFTQYGQPTSNFLPPAKVLIDPATGAVSRPFKDSQGRRRTF